MTDHPREVIEADAGPRRRDKVEADPRGPQRGFSAPGHICSGQTMSTGRARAVDGQRCPPVERAVVNGDQDLGAPLAVPPDRSQGRARERWFVGLNMDDPVWHPTTFTKNRDRLLAGEVTVK